MSLYTRSLIVLVTTLGSLALQLGLWWHVKAAGELEDVALLRSLADSMPKQFGDWVGEDLEVAEIAQYGDDYFKRAYVNQKNGQQLSLWMVYSKTGEDRGHHPEICLTGAGMAEDERARGKVEVPGHAAPIQQYLYGRPGSSQWIYYWYYTLKSPQKPGQSDLQQLYQKMQRRESSVTLEVFAPRMTQDSEQFAREFVVAVDKHMQGQLPKSAVRGSQRSPVKRVDEE